MQSQRLLLEVWRFTVYLTVPAALTVAVVYSQTNIDTLVKSVSQSQRMNASTDRLMYGFVALLPLPAAIIHYISSREPSDAER